MERKHLQLLSVRVEEQEEIKTFRARKRTINDWIEAQDIPDILSPTDSRRDKSCRHSLSPLLLLRPLQVSSAVPRVHVAPHKNFRRDRIHFELPISPQFSSPAIHPPQARHSLGRRNGIKLSFSRSPNSQVILKCAMCSLASLLPLPHIQYCEYILPIASGIPP